MTRRASEAMVRHGDGRIVPCGGVDVPEKQRFPIPPLHAELLVEVAVEDLAQPADTQGIAAHQTFDGGRVEGFAQEIHVGVELAVIFQPAFEAGDGHVGDAVELVEINVEVRLQLAFVIGFQLGLLRRQEGTVGIVNQIQSQPARSAIAEGIEFLEAQDAGVENALTPLLVDVLRTIAGHGGDDGHPVEGQKVRHVFVAGFVENSEVAAVDDGFHLGQGAEPFDEVSKIGNHFRRPAGQIDGVDVGVSEPVEDAVDGPARDDLLALGTGVHMTMDAGEIAEFARVDLEDLGAPAPWCEAKLVQGRGKAADGSWCKGDHGDRRRMREVLFTKKDLHRPRACKKRGGRFRS